MKGAVFLQVNSVASEYYRPPDNSREPLKALDKNAFLQLFVAQLKNQDPLSPQDSNTFITQLSQFSMLEQLASLNEEVTLARRFQELGEAAALLGRQVKVQTGDGDVSGQVEKVAVVEGEVRLFVNGTGYGLDKVTEVR
ncbi:MAG: flagellar hook capping protein [Pelotomaculum sp.]|nr:flagellar hook capping protein [Pelotomaculum sp.]